MILLIVVFTERQLGGDISAIDVALARLVFGYPLLQRTSEFDRQSLDRLAAKEDHRVPIASHPGLIVLAVQFPEKLLLSRGC